MSEVESTVLEIQMHFSLSTAAEYERLGMPAAEQRAIADAMRILETRLTGHAMLLSSPGIVRDLLRLRLAPLPCEVFGVLWLNAQNELMVMEELFRGTVTQATVYPREVVRRGLQLNAVSAIVYHNHPSGVPEPSTADELLTQLLKSSLAMVDIRLLDHVVVGLAGTTSLAERGLM